MGGGYAKNIQDTVEIQLETVRIAAEIHKTSTGIALEETHRLLKDA